MTFTKRFAYLSFLFQNQQFYPKNRELPQQQSVWVEISSKRN